MAGSVNDGYSSQRERLYARIRPEALEEQEDPLASYDDLVRWILDHSSDHTTSGLLELLEECLQKFHDDPRYTGAEYRYVKLWTLYADHVERPSLVYEYMMAHGIGKLYGPFFEHYSEALEREGRVNEADTIIALGIRTQSKPIKRLLKFQTDTQTRRRAGQSLMGSSYTLKEESLPEHLRRIRRDPLRNIASANLSHPHISADSTTANSATQPSSHKRPNPYAHLNAPPDPGKRPEILRFDLTLLLEADGTEYCFEEVRARHLGLLGKKWPPPPPPNAAMASTESSGSKKGDGSNERSVKVDFNDQGTRSLRPARRQSVTVTINTKQALEDVFEMYNSPEEDQHPDKIPDIKPTTATPSNLRTPAAEGRPVFRDENMVTGTKPRAFQPLSDQRRENIVPPLPRFQPVLSKTPSSNAFTPNLPRQVLTSKEVITPVPAFKVVRPPLQLTTPAPTIHELQPRDHRGQSNEDVFGGGDDVTTDEFTEEFTNPPPPPPPPRSFVPFTDNPNLKSSSDTNGQRNQETKILKFQIHRDENVGPALPTKAPITNGASTAGSSKVIPFQPSFRVHRRVDSELKNDVERDYDGPQYAEDRRVAMSNRFGHFEVMTPITERTAEFTASTRGQDTPSDKSSTSVQDRIFDASDAQTAAEKLAAELLEEEEEEDRNTFANGTADNGHEISADDDGIGDDSIGMRDSTQVLVLKSGFRPPNPCCPADVDIVSRLLTILPTDPIHRDLSQVSADRLKHLRRFVEKAKLGSGDTLHVKRGYNTSERFTLELDGDRFEVTEKLGEGGFGAVFMAEWIPNPDCEDEDEEDDGERPANPLVAIKAVRPSDLWEAYVLQRIISTIPEELRRTIIHPHTLYAFKDESFLILELCRQGTLLEIVNRSSKIGLSQPGGGMEELLVMFFTVELMRIVEGLHSAGFIHGDLKIDNCLIRLEDLPEDITWTSEYDRTGGNGWSYKGLKLIDFGRTIDTRLYPEGQAFIADWKTDQRDCIEMQEGRPWSYQADYAGLASIIYCMLYGKYIETTPYTSPSGSIKLKPSQPMKRYWQADLWNHAFEMLLNSSRVRDNHSLPIVEELAQLREKMEDWIAANSNKAGKNLKGMLKKIERESL